MLDPLLMPDHCVSRLKFRKYLSKLKTERSGMLRDTCLSMACNQPQCIAVCFSGSLVTGYMTTFSDIDYFIVAPQAISLEFKRGQPQLDNILERLPGSIQSAYSAEDIRRLFLSHEAFRSFFLSGRFFSSSELLRERLGAIRRSLKELVMTEMEIPSLFIETHERISQRIKGRLQRRVIPVYNYAQKIKLALRTADLCGCVFVHGKRSFLEEALFDLLRFLDYAFHRYKPGIDFSENAMEKVAHEICLSGLRERVHQSDIICEKQFTLWRGVDDSKLLNYPDPGITPEKCGCSV